MATEEKAKAYDESIERAKQVALIKEHKSAVEYIFPELAESEDERMRKKAIEYITLYSDEYGCWDEIKEVLAWLEKQKEKKPTFSNAYQTIINEGYVVLERADYDYLVKQSEQKPAGWSEEEEDNLICIEGCLEMVKRDYPMGPLCIPNAEMIDKALSFIKSRRPQTQWKPSEEQMEALNEASASWMNEKMGNSKLLESLYNDLKKL